MAATAAGGFRRYFGTGKSLSFVRPKHRKLTAQWPSLEYFEFESIPN